MPTTHAISTLRRPALQLAMSALLIALMALTACGSESGGDGDKGKTAAKGPTKKLPGPCSTTLERPDGKSFLKYIEYAWAADSGKPIEEKSGTGAIDAGEEIYTKKWGWDAKGRLIAEFFETNGQAPNINWTYTYDAKGRRATREGTHSSWGRVKCTYAYATDSKNYDIICKYELDQFDDEGKLTDTLKGTYSIQYTYGMQQITEFYDDGKGGSGSEITRRFDKAGNLIGIEIDTTLQGYPEKTTTFKYDAKNQRIERSVDEDADGTPEEVTTYTYDSYGNQLTAVSKNKAGELVRTLKHNYQCW